MGYKLFKWHRLLGVWWIVRMYASLLNIDTGRNENNYKKKKMRFARNTQRRIEVFYFQTAKIENQHETLTKAMLNANMDIPNIFELNFVMVNGD